MQCTFLIEAERPFCETGAFGMMEPKTKEYRKLCVGSSYHLCRVYRANTGNGDREKCLESISSQLVEV